MQVNGVFDAAQKAADMYLKNARMQAEDIIKAAHLRAREIIFRAESRGQGDPMPERQYMKLPDEPENE